MSYNWCFHSFDHAKFKGILATARKKVVDGVIDEMTVHGDYAPQEVENVRRVGALIQSDGFSYLGHADDDKKIIDRIVFDLFHICAEDIDFEPESSAFLSPSATVDFPTHFAPKKFFWSKPKPIDPALREYVYLPFFQGYGRRLGEQDPSPCEYIALDPHEVVALRREIETFLLTPDGAALNESFDNNIRDDFLGPVLSAIRKGKALHAQVS